MMRMDEQAVKNYTNYTELLMGLYSKAKQLEYIFFNVETLMNRLVLHFDELKDRKFTT